MYFPSLIILATVSLSFASGISPLNKRQDRIPCSELGMKTCGDVCIDRTDTCCPDRSGGCSSGNYCVLGDNGEYGCCPTGEICVGDGGAVTSTQTLPPPSPEEPTDESAPEPDSPVETDEPEIPDVTFRPAPLPTTDESPVMTDAAAANGLPMGNLISGFFGAAVLLL